VNDIQWPATPPAAATPHGATADPVPGGPIGERRPGLNNRRLARGKATFVGDIALDGTVHLAIVRSPYPHARILRIDATAALAEPGVLAVVDGREIAERTAPIPEGWDTAAVGARRVDWYALATDRVRFVGEAVAAVVAETRNDAYRALHLVDVDYEPLPTVTSAEQALAAGAPLVEPDWGTNVLVTRNIGLGDVDAGKAQSAGRVTGSLTLHRTTGVPMEPRGLLAAYDADEDLLTLWDSTQNPHPLRVYLAQTLRMSESRIRVIQPSVGGAFGLKQPTFQEEPLACYLALKLGRPVRWIEERSENFQVTGHARDMQVSYEAHYQADGTICALEADIVADVGAPTALVGWGMSFSASGLLPGPYRVPNVRVSLVAVATNKCPWNSYRGFGKDAANWWMERICDHIARDGGFDRLELRLRNFIRADEFPYVRSGGAIIDSGDYRQSLTKALEMIGADRFEERRRRAAEQGRLVGLGFGHELSPEGCGMPGSMMIAGYDGAIIRMLPTGEVTVLSGVTSPGSGNETGLAQIAASVLGCDISDVRVIQGDTEVCPWGLGNFSSRSIILGGSAVQLAAAELRDKLLSVAAKMLEASQEDLVLADGRASVRGAPARSVTLREVANEIYVNPFGPAAGEVEPGLESTIFFRAPNIYHQPERDGRFNAYPTWPAASVAAVVEVDPETGLVTLLDHCIVDDSGTVINPLLVEANLHGATGQAVGATLFEQISYDEEGQLVTASLMDYTIPTAVEMPRIAVAHQHSPSPFTPLGTKGAGESAIGAAWNAITSAVEDALSDWPLQLTELPLTPARLWHAIHGAGLAGTLSSRADHVGTGAGTLPA
jgi:aerobic carbon-monoxide dehydrogenase large subunit